MAENQYQRIGVIRYDFFSEYVLTSIYLDPELIGQGYGKKILLRSIGCLQFSMQTIFLRAQIKKDNLISRKLFEFCGFKEE